MPRSSTGEPPTPRCFALSLALLALFTAALYAATLGFDFVVYWDDADYVRDNAGVTAFDLGHLLTQGTANNYHPLTMLSLAVEHRLFGLTPAVFHATNVVFHVLTSVLVVLLLRRLLGGEELVPWLVGALFAVHPLHVESVAWISERKDVLSTFFYLAALHAYVGYCDGRGGRAYAGALVLGTLALLSKSMAVTLPAAMLLVDLLRRRGSIGKVLIEKLPFVALAAAAVVANEMVRASTHASAVHLLGPIDRVLTALDSLTFYVSRSFVPTGLSAIYDFYLVEVEAWQYVVAIAAVAATVWMLTREALRREVAWGTLFFLATIAPVLKLIPFGGVSLFNDRYMYLPSVGFFLVVALPFRGLPGWPRSRRIAALGGWAAALILLSVLTVGRIGVWRDSGTLFRDVVEKYPGCGLALTQLGLYQVNERSDRAGAIELFERAVAAQPALRGPYVALARTYLQAEDFERAEHWFDRTLDVPPEDPSIVYEAAVFHQEYGQPVRAIELYERCLPALGSARGYYNLGLAYFAQSDVANAERALRASIEVDPGLAAAYDSLARLYMQTGAAPKALEVLEQAEAAGAAVDPILLRDLRQGRPPR